MLYCSLVHLCIISLTKLSYVPLHDRNLITNESVCPTTTDLQMVHHPIHHHFSAF